MADEALDWLVLYVCRSLGLSSAVQDYDSRHLGVPNKMKPMPAAFDHGRKLPCSRLARGVLASFPRSLPKATIPHNHNNDANNKNRNDNSNNNNNN